MLYTDISLNLILHLRQRKISHNYVKMMLIKSQSNIRFYSPNTFGFCALTLKMTDL